MGARNHLDWSPLNRSSDPIAGDPDEVWDSYTSLRDTAAAIQDVIDGVKGIGNGADTSIGDSEAIDAWSDIADDVVDKLRKAKPRYEVAAEAMKEYYTALEDAREESLAALRDAEDAEDDKSTAQTKADAAEDDSPDASNADTALEEADGAMTAALGRLSQAVSDRDTAADNAKNKIHNKIENDDVKDSIWDNLKKLSDILKNISAVLGVLAIVVNFIPVIGQALSAALAAMALILGAIALVIDIGFAIDNGEGWGDVVLGAISVATFGVGRALTSGGKALAQASRTNAWSKLSRMNGPTAKELAGGGYDFIKKGPMTKGQAAAVMKNGAFGGPGGALKQAFGGLGGDMAGGFRALKDAGLSGTMRHLQDTPMNAGMQNLSGNALFTAAGTDDAMSAVRAMDGIDTFRLLVPEAASATGTATAMTYGASAATGLGGLSSGMTVVDMVVPGS